MDPESVPEHTYLLYYDPISLYRSTYAMMVYIELLRLSRKGVPSIRRHKLDNLALQCIFKVEIKNKFYILTSFLYKIDIEILWRE